MTTVHSLIFGLHADHRTTEVDVAPQHFKESQKIHPAATQAMERTTKTLEPFHQLTKNKRKKEREECGRGPELLGPQRLLYDFRPASLRTSKDFFSFFFIFFSFPPFFFLLIFFSFLSQIIFFFYLIISILFFKSYQYIYIYIELLDSRIPP